jgi:hypothetical protein
MLEIFADPPDRSCYLLFSGPGIEESQWVDPDPSLHRVRDARGGFAEARRPAQPATRHPQSKRRVPDLATRLLRAEGAVGSDRPQASSVAAARRSTIVAASPFRPPGEAGGCPGLWRPLRAAESAPGTGCSALAVGRTARFLRSFAGRVAEAAARPELETNHGA